MAVRSCLPFPSRLSVPPAAKIGLFPLLFYSRAQVGRSANEPLEIMIRNMRYLVQAEAELGHGAGVSPFLAFPAPSLWRRLGQLRTTISRLSLGLTHRSVHLS